MRWLRSLTIYFGVVFVGGALLAPWLYWLVEWGAAHMPALGELAASPFHRFVTRMWLGLALLGLLPLLRSLGMRSWRDVGLTNPAAAAWGSLARGFALGFGSLAVVAVIALAAGARELKPDVTMGWLAIKLSGAALTAGVLALIEEVLFRGALFGAIRRVSLESVALAVSSALYALVHFFGRPDPPAAVNWASGLTLMPQMLRGLADVHQFVPGFFALTLAGLVLAMAYARTGTLFFSVGLHGGWIFWLKSYGLMTQANGAGGAWFWGTRRLIDGWLTVGVLVFCLLLVSRISIPAEPVRARECRPPR